MSGTSDETIGRLHREAPFTDVHAHPSLKAWLYGRNLWKHRWSGKAFNPISSRSDFRCLERGGVGVLWAAHYLPERQLFQDCRLARVAATLLVRKRRRLFKGSLFKRLLEMMDALEREIERCPEKTELARSAEDVVRIRQAGKIAVVHTVEGAHVLEGDPEKLDKLAERGVAMLTLCHFYPNQLAAHVDGIPKKMLLRKLCKFRFGDHGSPPLTNFGRDVLEKLGTLSMIVDVSHCTPEAREAIYAELDGERPVIASHVGVRHLNPDPYNVSDDEIREIARRGGAIGVIFLTYWLDKEHPKKGLEAIWRTIKHIQSVTGSWDHIVLGTDFDGFTDPPNDLKNASRLGRVTRMLLDRGVPEEAIKKILGGNAQRVLEAGWR